MPVYAAQIATHVLGQHRYRALGDTGLGGHLGGADVQDDLEDEEEEERMAGVQAPLGGLSRHK